MTSITAAPRKPGRPPKIPREQLQTREMLVRCGTEILTEQGFMATGIDVVLKRVGVPKGSFYHYFDSKEAFGQAVLANYAEYFARKLDRWLLDTSLPPLQRLRGFVDEAKAGMARHGFRRGCLVGNLGQEVTLLPDSYREQLDAVLRSWELRLSHCLQAAQDAGELARDTDCAALANFFWIGWEGAVLRARLVRSEAPLETFMQGFARCLAH
ncbi:TetR family transcriptional regulator C-terminal domain-containing protein [Pseudomonas gingeri]|uniref:acrylate utilization transcriptional regulator AcuR n=1 Tax=Pseudomonas TaxID=286 RepID=UPI0015A126CC|nr:TetR/AcrR family transcriptional regulator [Pseudomonas gingeri]NVZ66696.1 TetR family transcriptional regulator C-terminal domain-containing protein [Pseudomonas gingeri]NVZ74785.1 TetR family transcriptional regulator C-terminal domain-containing protein [Pseudomonas gingeri]NWE48697.1 TetR family transcriptional regulator C-terminal domain-containing protein [Pseudomonas gingeri]NWE72210.1 TetR family transcriptional regulator C-terminal domain-containing protein [Pseudomonas gingeri]